MVGRELDGHVAAEVVAYDAGPRQPEVRAESVKEPATVAHPVARARLVRLAEAREVQGVHGEALREPPGYGLPDARRGEPAVDQHHGRAAADHVVAHPRAVELQELGVAGAVHLVCRAAERERGHDDDRDQQKQNYENGTHEGNDNPNAPRSAGTSGRRIGAAVVPRGALAATQRPPDKYRDDYRGAQRERGLQEALLHVVAHAPDLRLIQKVLGEPARQHERDARREDGYEAFFGVIAHGASPILVLPAPGRSGARRVLPGIGQVDASSPAVEAGELGSQLGAHAEAGVAVDAEDDLLRAPRVKVVLHHEIEKLRVAVPHLVDELRKRDAARDQTLARLADVELAEAPVGMPDYKPGDDIPCPRFFLDHAFPL